MPDVLLGFGGNLGDPVRAIADALRCLEEAGLGMKRRSSFYRTKPWGGVPQPDFVNLCALMDTDLAPDELLGLTQKSERDLGRVGSERWGPRAIDIDILVYEGAELKGPDLILPHPRIVERAFVLVPLAEIAPELELSGRTIRAWAEAVDRTGIERLDPGPDRLTTST